jgi:hypothetical protein
MKITRRGLFKTAGAVVVAPALAITHEITRDPHTGTFWIAFYINGGVNSGDLLELTLYGESDGPMPWCRLRGSVHFGSEPKFSGVKPVEPPITTATFPLPAAIVSGIRSRGTNRYQVTIIRQPGPIHYLSAEGTLSATGSGSLVMLSGKGARPNPLPRRT